RRSKMNGIKGLIALAFGTLSLGVAEFVMMGLLPYIAKDFDVSVATAGHAISAYAFGVMVGALALAFLHKFKLKHIVIALVVVQLVGIVATSFANSFNILLLTRFISGLPHGCFFGVGAIVAQRIATNGKGNSAVAIMVAGMTVANVFGVPLGTALAHSVSWRVVFYLLFFWGLIVLFSVIKWLPDTGKIPPTTFKTQFKFLKTVAPWLVLLATFFGNGGMFCVLSYVSPMLTQFGSLPLSYVSAVMVGIGLSMVFGNLISGHLADKLRSGKVFMYFHIMGVVTMILMAAIGFITPIGVVLACLIGLCLFAVGTPQQVSILHTAIGGPLIGSAMIQVAFNFGNMLGALIGGVPFTFNLNLGMVAIFGALLGILGVVCAYLYQKKYELKCVEIYKQQQLQTNSN
ncbi:MAG: MFS transporter, partial [Succinivibrio sp.]|nr:MFS transporter [Succinivibrio sp.]